jgi:hypothetical protein
MIKEPKSHLQRNAERHRVTIPVQVNAYEGNGYVDFSGEARDFSESGLCLILTRTLEKGVVVSMDLRLPYHSESMTMRGIVRHRNGFHHGVEFISLTTRQKEVLERTSRVLSLLS